MSLKFFALTVNPSVFWLQALGYARRVICDFPRISKRLSLVPSPVHAVAESGLVLNNEDFHFNPQHPVHLGLNWK